MANGLTRKHALKLHQTLHGYADGHRQLGASTLVQPKDLRTLLLMSDVSGPGAQLDEHGYLTGYPLVDSGVYALARTWPAPEMPRPGCVWTHTLLIDFADLATISSPVALLDLFHKPCDSSFQQYNEPLLLETHSHNVQIPKSAIAWSRKILTALYVKPHSSVVTARPAEVDIERTILAIWSQQWPRLRRSFRFCTYAASDRVGGKPFDLQVIPSSERNSRVRFQASVEAKAKEEDWIDDALEDLLKPDISGLRTFIRRVGADITAGREAFSSLCRLHKLVSVFGVRPAAIDEAVLLLEVELGSEKPRSAQFVVARSALENVERLNDTALSFLLEHVSLVSSDLLEKNAYRLGRVLWQKMPTDLLENSEQEGFLASVVPYLFRELPLQELILGLHQNPVLIERALNERPELAAQPNFWIIDLLDFSDILAAASYVSEYRAPALAAIMAAGRDDLAKLTVKEFGSAEVLRAIALEFERLGEAKLRAWIDASVDDVSTLAQYLACELPKPRALLGAIARRVLPNAVKSSSDQDPWVTAYNLSSGPIPDEDEVYLMTFLLGRAFGLSSGDPGSLVQLSFEPIYYRVSVNTLPEDNWRQLDLYLPPIFPWFYWDRCKRIREGVVQLFVEGNLAPQIFERLTDDKHIFRLLVQTAGKNERGRGFLRQLWQYLRSDPGRFSAFKMTETEKYCSSVG